MKRVLINEAEEEQGNIVEWSVATNVPSRRLVGDKKDLAKLYRKLNLFFFLKKGFSTKVHERNASMEVIALEIAICSQTFIE